MQVNCWHWRVKLSGHKPRWQTDKMHCRKTQVVAAYGACRSSSRWLLQASLHFCFNLFLPALLPKYALPLAKIQSLEDENGVFGLKRSRPRSTRPKQPDQAGTAGAVIAQRRKGARRGAMLAQLGFNSAPKEPVGTKWDSY